MGGVSVEGSVLSAGLDSSVSKSSSSDQSAEFASRSHTHGALLFKFALHPTLKSVTVAMMVENGTRVAA